MNVLPYERTSSVRTSAAAMVTAFQEVKDRAGFHAVLKSPANREAMTWLNNQRPGLHGLVRAAMREADRRTRTDPEMPFVEHDADRAANICDILWAMFRCDPAIEDHPLTEMIRDRQPSHLLMCGLIAMDGQEAERIVTLIEDARFARLVDEEASAEAGDET